MFISPSLSVSTPKSESFAARAESLCNRVLSTMTSGASRHRKKCAPYNHVREWTNKFVLIDWQGENSHQSLPFYDYHKLFDGLIKLLSDMTEFDVRDEIVRLIKLKSIPTHQLSYIMPDGFDFFKKFIIAGSDPWMETFPLMLLHLLISTRMEVYTSGLNDSLCVEGQVCCRYFHLYFLYF